MILHSDALIRRAIIYSALYNQNWNEPRQKYILTSKHLYDTYRIYIPHDKLKQHNTDISSMVEKNSTILVSNEMRQALNVTNHMHTREKMKGMMFCLYD